MLTDNVDFSNTQAPVRVTLWVKL